jgi:hypothetical protein
MCSDVICRWPDTISADLADEIVRVMREITAETPIIGFGRAIDDREADAYISDLRDDIACSRSSLLEIRKGRDLSGICTVTFNTNPNNRHLCHLSKGMIPRKYRGGPILALGLYEIALRCESRGVDLVTLDVRVGTQAEHVWRKFGFEVYGTLDDYARAGEMTFAGHYMMQKVSSLKARALFAIQSRSGSVWKLSAEEQCSHLL